MVFDGLVCKGKTNDNVKQFIFKLITEELVALHSSFCVLLTSATTTPPLYPPLSIPDTMFIFPSISLL